MKTISFTRRLRTDDTTQFPGNLTPHERRVIEAVAEHGDRSKAATALCISVHTFSDHLKSASRKADAHKSVQLVARYLLATEAA